MVSIFQSVNIGSSFEYLFRFFNTIILVAFIYELLKNRNINLEQINNIILFSILIFSLYYIYGTEFKHIFISEVAFSPIGHFNYTAQVFDIWIPLLLLNFFIQKQKILRYISLLLMLLLIDILVISVSRGAIVSLAIAESVVFISLIVKYKKIRFYPIFIPLIVLSFLLHQSFAPPTMKRAVEKIKRLESTTPKESLNAISSNRINIYRNTIDMIIDNPLGVGIGNFEYIHPKYAKVGTPYATNYVNEFEVFTNPHNLVLNYTSELGWGGGIIFIIILILLIRVMFINIFRGDTTDYYIAIAFMATLSHSMLSAIFLTPVNLFFMTILLAILIYRYDSNSIFFIIKRVYLKLLIVIIPLFFLSFYISKYYCNQFSVQRNFKYIKKAILFNPFNNYAYLKYARYEAYGAKDYTLAIFYIDKVLKLYPYNINALIKKASWEYRLREYNQSLKTINKLLLIDKENKKGLFLLKKAKI
jgi:tetratricopeptide (TPR) repeat protein